MKKFLPLLVVLLFFSACTNITGNNSGTPTPSLISSPPIDTPFMTFHQQDFNLDLYLQNNRFIYYLVVTLPNPCTQVTVQPMIAESYPEQVTINVNTIASSGICTQVITDKTLTGEIAVSAQASFTVKYNGNVVAEAQ